MKVFNSIDCLICTEYGGKTKLVKRGCLYQSPPILLSISKYSTSLFQEDQHELSPISQNFPFQSDRSPALSYFSGGQPRESTSIEIEADLSVDVSDGVTNTTCDDLIDVQASRKFRTPHSRSSIKFLYKRALNPQNIRLALRKKCCKNNCKISFSETTLARNRHNFWSLSREYQDSWIYDKINDKEIKDDKIMLKIEKYICPKAFMQTLSLNKNRYYKLLQKSKQGLDATLSRQRKKSKLYVEALHWLEEFARFYGDRMPDSGNVMLPYKSRKIDIYKKYKDNQTIDFLPSLSRSHFHKMWKTEFFRLKIKKTNSFSKCNICTALERRLQKTRNTEAREQIKIQREQHNDRQMNERKAYYRKREMSKQRPEKYISIIIDGMDQSKTNLPHFAGRKAKCINAFDQLQIHVTGIISHGHNKKLTFTDFLQYPHDSNLSMNVILKSLYHLAVSNEKLSEILYLQADNCYRENKNKYMLSFCELLVHLNIFREVHLSFLFVGHTHEDIDSMFSTIADQLRRTDAETLPELLYLLPNPQQLHGMFDIRTWLTPHLAETIKGHTKPHQFKFVKNEKESVCVYYRGSSRGAWQSSHNFFRRLSNTSFSLPSGTPEISVASFERVNIDGMQKSLNQWHTLFSDQRDDREFQWWQTHIKRLDVLKKNEQERLLYSRNDATWVLPLLPKYHITEEVPQDGPLLPNSIMHLVEAEKNCPEVSILPRMTRVSFLNDIHLKKSIVSVS